MLLILCLATLFTAGFAAPQKPVAPPQAAPSQDTSPVTVDSARPVTEIVDETNAYLATVSPDGKYIAYGKQSGKRQDRVLQLCLFEFETAAKNCSDLSPDVFDGYPYQFQWSPDSRYIAFTENPIEIASESDIWLFDSEVAGESSAFNNLTDDGLVGVWSYFPSQGEQPILDYLPMWHPSDGMIYFWRIVPLGNFRYTIGLYRIAPEGGEPELVRDLTSQFAAQIPLYDYERLFLDGVSAISPDGNTVATLMTMVNDMGGTEQSLWTIDIADTKAAPESLAGVENFMSAIPEWAQDFPPQAQGLSWTANGEGIVVVVNTALNPSIPFQVYYYVDVAGGGITPVVDFSGLEELDSYSEPAPGSELPWRAYSPWTGSLSPEGDKLLMVNDLGGTVALFTATLPPTGDLPLVSASADESSSSGVANSSRGEGGKVTAWGLLINIAEQ
jgi:hypothetical protein